MLLVSRKPLYKVAANLPGLSVSEQYCRTIRRPDVTDKTLVVTLAQPSTDDLYRYLGKVYAALNTHGKVDKFKGHAALTCYGTGLQGEYELNETWTFHGAWLKSIEVEDVYDYTVPDVTLHLQFDTFEFKSNRQERWEAMQKEIREWESL